MKTRLLRITVVALGALAAMIGESYWVYSCGPGPDYERFRISYVDPDLLSDSLYQSLYRTLLREHQGSVSEWGNAVAHEFQGYAMESARDEELVDSWSDYFGPAVSPVSIRDVLYGLSAARLDSAFRTLSNGGRLATDTIIDRDGGDDWNEPDTLAVGDLFAALTEKRDTGFLRYLLFAREASTLSRGAWDTREPDTSRRGRLIRLGEERYQSESSPFLRRRYAYHVVRLARYAGRNAEAVAYYNRMIAPTPERDIIRYEALSQKAGALRILGDSAGANLCFANVFDSSEALRERSVRDFRMSDEKGWQRLFNRARNDHERMILWMMRGLKKRALDFEYMKRMASIDPGSPFLSIAMMRELHRIESYLYDDLLTRDRPFRRTGRFPMRPYGEGSDTMPVTFTNVEEGWNEEPYREGPAFYYLRGGYQDYYRRHISRAPRWDTLFFIDMNDTTEPPGIDHVVSGSEYVAAFRHFVFRLAQRGTVADPALWYMVAGYVDLMNDDFRRADDCLGRARVAAGKNTDLIRQIDLLDYLGRRRRGGVDRAGDATMIADALEWLEAKQRANRHSKYDKVMEELGRDYLRRGDVARAVLAFYPGPYWRKDDASVLLDAYATDADLIRLEKLLARPHRTGLDKTLTDSFTVSLHQLRDLRGTRLMRRMEFAQALRLYRTLPESYWDTANSSWDEPRFTTNALVVERHIPWMVWRGNWLTARTMNRKEFAEEIVRLSADGKSPGGRGDSALLRIANLLYNTPEWGDAGFIGWWRFDEMLSAPASYPFNIESVDLRMQGAIRRYTKEYGSRTQARAYYKRVMRRTKDRELAAFCANMLDLCDKQPQTRDHPLYSIAEQPREGYTLLMTKYRDTRYATAALSQCSVYRGFAGR